MQLLAQAVEHLAKKKKSKTPLVGKPKDGDVGDAGRKSAAKSAAMVAPKRSCEANSAPIGSSDVASGPKEFVDSIIDSKGASRPINSFEVFVRGVRHAYGTAGFKTAINTNDPLVDHITCAVIPCGW
jgi:hypothetical protein